VTNENEDVVRRVREAFAASVALMMREVESVDVDPAALLADVEPELVARVLAALMATILGVTMGDGGRRLLGQIGMHNATAQEPPARPETLE
jgi:hypothetical protein